MSRARSLLDYFDSHNGEALDLLQRFVDVDSPTSDKNAVDRLGALVAAAFETAGAVTSRVAQAGAGDLLRASFGPASQGARPAILLAHLDTVWPPGEAARRPFRIADGIATGPGVYDMKVGIVLCLMLARAAREGRFEPVLPIVCLLSGDEEAGSPVSRPHIEEAARGSAYVLGLEPSTPQGGAKTRRKGVGRIRLEVTGQAAHAGIDPGKGVNAIEEIAAQILAVKKLDDPSSGTSIHAGLVRGGVARNVVAPGATVEFDVRVTTQDGWTRVEDGIRLLRPHHPGARLKSEMVLSHPPMTRSDAIASLYEQARRAASEIGFDLGEGETGGGSDGSLCAAVGAPVLDGLGVEGDGAHAVHEFIRVDRIAPRAAFLARILETVAGP